MSKYDFLVLNGPNLGHLGKRQPEIYGHLGMDAVPGLVENLLGPASAEVKLSFVQANSEGALIDQLEKAHSLGMHGVAFNAGAFTHTSLALADCLAWIDPPCVEVHLSNIWARTEDPIRQKSHMGKSCIGVIAGFGISSYALAVRALYDHLEAQNKG